MTYRVLHDAQCENEMPSLEHLGGRVGKTFFKISYIQDSLMKVRHVNPFLKTWFHRREKHINICMVTHNIPTQYQGFNSSLASYQPITLDFKNFSHVEVNVYTSMVYLYTLN